MAAACPGTPHAEILVALDEHAVALRREAAEMTDEAAAVERLSAVLAELVRRLDEGDVQTPSSEARPTKTRPEDAE